ncbi:MAG: Ig-like domain-containing protein [Butyrivibrio sp.]|nr:Ig-like domain-containing protein [Acetatifactor muris]MCM1559882.1 Ig-like domain-containing protein [Butyrivibrio sp.]
MKKIFNHTKRPDKGDNSWKDWETYEEDEAYPEEEEPYTEEDGYYADEEEPYTEEDGYYADEEEPYTEGDGYYAEEEESYTEGDGYYAEEEESYAGEDGYYPEEEESYTEGDGYYAEEEEPYAEGDGYYAEEEGPYAEAESYAAEGAYTGDEAYYAEEEGAYTGEGEIIYEDDDLYNADYRGESGRGDRDRDRAEGGWLIRKLREMTVMDRVIAGTGVAVLVLAMVTGAVLMTSRMAANQVSDFVSVGAQLENIELIGEDGLLAVADAQIARLEAAAMVGDPDEADPSEEEDDPGYEESEYSRQVSVEMNMTSIQKDLKIKFTNAKTGKLVANVPFSVTVTDPDGKSSIWSDDDMDGIIYKKDIAAGTYKVAMEELSDEKYANYSISTETRTVKVKKDIAYEKVDVANEVKTESEVDAKKEDTAQKDTAVESVLQDTVAWVESTAVGVSYIEVKKSDITDPLTILTASVSLDKEFLRMTLQSAAVTVTAGDGGTKLQVGGTTQLKAEDITVSKITGNAGETITDVTTGSVKWESSNAAVATVDAGGLVKGVAAGTATITYTAEVTVTYTVTPAVTPEPSPTPEPAPTPTPEPTQDPSVSGGDVNAAAEQAAAESAPAAQTEIAPEAKTEKLQVSGSISIEVAGQSAKGTITADKTALSVVIKGTATAQITAKDFETGKDLVYQVSSDKDTVATAAVDAAGKVTITGVTAGTANITVTANYKEGGTPETEAKAVIAVTVGANKTIELSSTATLAYVANPLVLSITVKGASGTTPQITVESSDATVMKATLGTLKAENNVITAPVTLELLKTGSATLTVKCAENGEEVKAVCAVTVKANPKADNTTLLLDKSKQQLYVYDNNIKDYRQAKYADYYTYDKFYVKGEVKYTGWQTLNGQVYYFTAEGKKVTGEQVIQGAKYNFASDGALVTGSGAMGIDVSKWNGTIDWNAVKNSGVSYVIIRCGYRGSSQGALIEDPKFQANIKGATAAGLKVGVYFFTQAIDEREAVEEASMVLGLIKNYKISYPVFLDVESSGGRADSISKETRTAVCKAFCQTIQNAGYTAGIYANKTWLENRIDAGALSAYKIWLAQYAQTPTYVGRYDLWQYRSTGRVSGISGNVDLNLSYLGY